jgi:hypothetical protein
MSDNNKPLVPVAARWHADLSVHAADRRWRERFLWLIGWLIVLGTLVAAALVALVYWLRPFPQPILLSIALPGQAGLLPYAAADRTALRDCPDLIALGSTELEPQWEQLAARGAIETVVVHLNAPARPTPDGIVLGPTRDAPTLRGMLQRLSQVNARYKLLLLDIAWPVSDARAGELVEAVAAAIPLDLDAVPDPRRLTLTACAPSEVAHAAPELEQTVFGHYVGEALRGWADGATGDRNGRITAREVTAFVQARVDRWARTRTPRRQMPQLYGPADLDFTLVVLERMTPKTQRITLQSRPYPEWLTKAWGRHAEWWADDAVGRLPWLLRQQAALLSRAEADWRNGTEEPDAQGLTERRLNDLDSRRTVYAAVPAPPVPSLAFALSLRQLQPDAASTTLLGSVLERVAPLAKSAEVPNPATLSADTGKLRQLPTATLGQSALTNALNSATAARLRALRALLAAQTRTPLYAETLRIDRYTDLMPAPPTGDSDKEPPATGLAPELAGRFLDLARGVETQAARWHIFPWIADCLTPLAQERHDAEVLLFAPDFVRPADVELRLRRATTTLNELATAADGVTRLLAIYHEALATLPLLRPLAERLPRYEPTWFEAVKLTEELYERLTATPTHTTAALDLLRDRYSRSQPTADGLRALLAVLRKPFTPEELDDLRARLRSAEATPGVWDEADLIASLPWVPANERKALWDAQQELARRLTGQVLAADAADDAAGRITPLPLPAALARDQARRAERALAVRRAQLAATELRLAGVRSLATQALDTALAPGSRVPFADWPGLLTAAWGEALSTAVRQAKADLAGERLARVLGPDDPTGLLDRAATNPTVRYRAELVRTAWTWYADHARYEAAAPVDALPTGAWANFYRTQAQQLVSLADELPALDQLSVPPQSMPPALTPSIPSRDYDLRIRRTGPAGPALPVVATALDPPAWLRTVPPQRVELAPFAETTVPVRVAFLPTTNPKEPIPTGLLVELRHLGRTYHHRIPVAVGAVAGRIELVAAGPDEPFTPLTGLRFRPNRRQFRTIAARNPSERPRKIIAQITLAGVVVPGSRTPIVLIPPNGTQPLPFPPIVPPTTDGSKPIDPLSKALLPELTGALGIQLLDADQPGEPLLDSVTIPVQVSAPMETVNVARIQYTPPSMRGGNQLLLELRPGPGLTSDPSPVELTLPPERIPGLRGVADGSYRTELERGTQAVVLYANGLSFAPDVEEEEGFLHLAIDGVERALVFATTFTRAGQPTTPRLTTTPALRLRTSPVLRVGTPLPFVIEVDAAPPGATVELRLGRKDAGELLPDVTRKFRSGRQERIGFVPGGPNGTLVFAATVSDWRGELPTARIIGQRTLQARLLHADGRELLRAEQAVTLDESPPSAIEWVDLPKQAPRARPLIVRVRTTPPPAGIKSVVVIVGKLGEEAVPPTANKAIARPADEQQKDWVAELNLASERTGPLDLTAVVESNVGVTARLAGSVNLFDGPPPADVQAGLRGRVLESERPQAGLEVTLTLPTGAAPRTTKTDADGNFRFDDLPAGKFTVSATKRNARRAATQTVELKANERREVTLRLLLTAE